MHFVDSNVLIYAASPDPGEEDKHEINLIREYRTRLIADVVTGKLDVREAAKTLPNADLSSSVDETDIMQAESKAPKVKFGSAGEADL